MKNDDDIFLGEIRKMMRYQQEPPEISYLRDDINKIDREEYEQDNWLEKNTTKNHETEKGQLYHNEFYLYEVMDEKLI